MQYYIENSHSAHSRDPGKVCLRALMGHDLPVAILVHKSRDNGLTREKLVHEDDMLGKSGFYAGEFGTMYCTLYQLYSTDLC